VTARAWYLCVAVVLVLALSLSRHARADEPGGPGWSAPSATAQLAVASGAMPSSHGALLVPCLASADVEPPVVVRADGEARATGRCGERIPLPPGDYQLRLGSDPLGSGRARDLRVTAGETTLVPADWSGLRVQVVDRTTVPFRGAYEVVGLPSLHHVGVGFGAAIERGERLSTWILEPGPYMLLARGGSYQAREDFFTLQLKPGELTHLVLVIDPDDGSFRGAGDLRLLRGAGTTVEERLTLSWVVGVEASFIIREGVPGTTDTTEVGPGFYTDLALTWRGDPHFVFTRLKWEGAYTQEDWGRFEKELDRLRLDGLYAYGVLPWLGPYARAGIDTPVFPSFLYFDAPRGVVDAERPERALSAGSEFQTARAFAPLTLKEGVGLRAAAAWAHVVDLWALAGVGARHVFTRGLWSEADDPSTDALEVQRRDDPSDVGPEATLFLELTPARWLLLTTELEVFAPFDALDDPTLSLESEAALRLTSLFAITYGLRLRRVPAISERLQWTHEVLFRFSYTVL
jgi:hypothetical protein